jgi:hypothetical protein
MDTPSKFTCDMVIARYKEQLPWLPKYNSYTFRNIYLYNKNEADNTKSASELGCTLNGKECVKQNLKNEGRCDHTYLYHIINNYDNLADVTIFTKGSSDMHRERKKLEFTIKKVFETRNTVMSIEESPTALHVHAGTFKLNSYTSSHPSNKTGEDIYNIKMKPAEIRPFGKWYQKHFPQLNIYKAVYAGVFAVSRNHIHQHPKSYYQQFIKELEGHSNPEVGHYFERAWVAIFHPIPDTFLYNSIIHEAKFGGRRKKRARTKKIKNKMLYK